jgi:hypothetical protein
LVTLLPEQEIGLGDNVTIEGSRGRAVSDLTVDAELRPVPRADLIAEESDVRLTAKATDFAKSNPAHIDFTATNDFGQELRDVGVGVLFRDEAGRIVGGWRNNHDEKDTQPGIGLTQGQDEQFPPGESEHTIETAVTTDVGLDGIEVYLWP